MANTTFTFKKGEIGKEIGFTLSDADGPVDLTSWTVTLTVAERSSSTPVFSGEAVTKRTQSGATLGQCYHTLNSTTANITEKDYKACELKLTNGSQVRYWPVNKDSNRTYFSIEVQKAMA